MKKWIILCFVAFCVATGCSDSDADPETTPVNPQTTSDDKQQSQTALCTANSVRCSEAGVPQKCVDGTQWVDQTACQAKTSCQNGVCEPETAPADKVCDENATQCSQAGVPQKCIHNTWIDQAACTNGNICKDGDCEAEAAPTPSVTQLSCKGVADGNSLCQTMNGEEWAFGCYDKKVMTDLDYFGNCTQRGMICYQKELNDGPIAYCGCNDDTHCADQEIKTCNKTTHLCETA